jgi:hypothetical protein
MSLDLSSPEALLGLSTPQQLAQLVGNRSDAELHEALSAIGVEVALDRVFQGMVEHFLPAKAGGRHAVLEWTVRAPSAVHTYHLKLAGNECSYLRGPSGSAHVRLTAPVALFLRLVAGRTSGLQAYSDGSLSVNGDAVLALQQQTFFDADLSGAQLAISRPSELKRLLAGRSDAEIEAGAQITGLDKVLDQVFDGMVQHFVPRRAGRSGGAFEWSVRTPEGDKVYHLNIDGGRASYRRGGHEKPRVTFMTRLPSFMRLVAGELDGLRALAQGRLKVKGNLLLAKSFQGWFDTAA